MKLNAIFMIIAGLSTISAFAGYGSEVQNSFPVKALRHGHEFSLEKPLLVRAGFADPSRETSVVTFQNGQQTKKVTTKTVSCDLKIEGNFTNDEVLEARIMGIKKPGTIENNVVTWKLADSIISEMRCVFPDAARMVVGDLKKAFDGEEKMVVQEADDFDEIVENED